MGTASRILIGLVFSTAFPSSLRAADTAPPELHKLHALFMIDTDAENVGNASKIDCKRMEILLRGGIPKDRLELTILTGKDCTEDRVVKYYKGLKSGPSDSLLCYFGGHGGTDPVQGHFFDMSHGGPFLRSKLRALMYEHRPGLAIILTDCCSVCVTVDVKRNVLQLPGAARQLDPALGSLFFRHRGLVDITGASGNVAWCNDDTGSNFTVCLAKVIEKHSHLARDGREPFTTWKNVFPQIQQETIKLSWDANSGDDQKGDPNAQKYQKPQAFDLPDDPTRPYLTLQNNSQAVVRYQYRWDNESLWSAANMPPGGDRLHSIPPVIAGPDRPLLHVKFDDGETGTLHAGKRYRYSPGPKKTRGLDEDAESP